MRSLAEVIMSGRWQAVVMALLGIPLISPAAVGLVTLRKGALEGAWVALAMLGMSVAVLFMVESGWLWYLLPSISFCCLVFVASLILRVWVSWSLCLVVTSLLGVLSNHIIFSSFDLREDLMAMASHSASELNRIEFEKMVELMLQNEHLKSSMAVGVVLGAFVSLVIARYWQALLYNPGGFKAEFQSLRIQPRQAFVAVAFGLALVYVANASTGHLTFILPLSLAGLGFVHWFLDRNKLAWMVWIAYVGLLLPVWNSILVLFLAGLGLVDAAVDLRKKISA